MDIILKVVGALIHEWLKIIAIGAGIIIALAIGLIVLGVIHWHRKTLSVVMFKMVLVA